MTPVTIPLLSRFFDEATIGRGRAYVADGRVLKVDAGSGARQRVMVGEVRGSAGRPYVVTVTRDVDGEILDTRCTCPVGVECKHAVAVLLAADQPAEPPPPMWTRELDGFLEDLEQRTAGPPAFIPLALEVECREVQSRWSNAAWTLPFRPVKRGRRDNWVKSGVSWHDVQTSLRYVGDHDPAQVEVLRDIATLFMRGYGQHNPDLVHLGPMMWSLLKRARDAGIQLLPGPGLSAVTFDDTPQRVTADLTEIAGVGDGPDLTLRFGLEYGGEWWPGSAGDMELVGEPAHGVALMRRVIDERAWGAPQRELILAPLMDLLPAGMQRRVSARSPVRVPAADRDRFEAQYVPRLRRQVRLESSDGSVEFQPERPPQLVCRLAWSTDARASTSWVWRYQHGLQPQEYDLDSADGFALVRLADAERQILAALAPPTPLEPKEWTDRALVDFVEDVLPRIRAAADSGAFVLAETGVQRDFRAAEQGPAVTFTSVEGTDRDWLDLGVSISVDGESLPLGSVLTALTTGQELIFTESGRHIASAHPAFAQLAELVIDAGQIVDQPSGGLRVARSDLALWAELEALGVVDEQARAWAGMALALRDFDGLPEVTPSGLTSVPRPYQAEGISWLAYLWRMGLGGVLADDMGLGKTLQTLAMVAHAREHGAGPFLVVAPTSVIGTWVSEAARHTPGLVARPVLASSRRRDETLAQLAEGADIVVTSYTLFRLEAESYQAREWGGLILDEAHTVKNHQGKTYQAVRRLDVPFRLALTGTPFENRLMELWALLSIVAPGLYPWPKRFTEAVVRPVEQGDEVALARFRRRIRPFMLRRTKDLVADDLPPKQEQVLEIELSARHRKIYDTHLQRERQTVLGLVDDFDRNRIAIFGALTRLRQLSLDPALVDTAHESVGSAKLDALVEHLHELASEGHRALVFSQFTSYLKRVQARLTSEGLDSVYLDGRTRNRPEVIDSFKTGTQPAFLISLKAGGSGLTLTEADYVFVLDPWWNPAVEAQAIDRVHRIGQTQHVMAYRLVAKDTIEEKVMALKAAKAALFTQVLDGDGAMSTSLGADDVRALFDD